MLASWEEFTQRVQQKFTMDVQLERCELSFIWGKMTATRETAPQLALGDCSKEVVGKVSMCDFGEGGVRAIAHLFHKRYVSASYEEPMSP